MMGSTFARAGSILLALVVALMTVSAASAQPTEPCNGEWVPTVIENSQAAAWSCVEAATDPAPAPAPVDDDPSPSPITAPPSAPPPTVEVRTLHRLDDGSSCFRIRPILLDGREESEVRSQYNTQFFLAMERLPAGTDVVECPVEPGGPVVAEAPPIGEPEVVFTFVQRVPQPDPQIQPGFMIVNMPAFLETGRELVIEETVDAGPDGMPVMVELRATGSYTVDWGDGTVEGPFTVPGAPWPGEGRAPDNSHVTHTYRRAGDVVVTVVDTWELQWRFAGSSLWSVPLTLELTPAVLDDFRVEEVRSVRVRPES